MDTEIAPTEGGPLNQIRALDDRFALLAFFHTVSFLDPNRRKACGSCANEQPDKRHQLRERVICGLSRKLETQRQRQNSPQFSAGDWRQQQPEMESKSILRS
jgi:hypothetical protein